MGWKVLNQEILIMLSYNRQSYGLVKLCVSSSVLKTVWLSYVIDSANIFKKRSDFFTPPTIGEQCLIIWRGQCKCRLKFYLRDLDLLVLPFRERLEVTVKAKSTFKHLKIQILLYAEVIHNAQVSFSKFHCLPYGKKYDFNVFYDPRLHPQPTTVIQTLKMIDEWLSSPILRETISESQTGIESAIFWWPVRRSNHWAT